MKFCMHISICNSDDITVTWYLGAALRTEPGGG